MPPSQLNWDPKRVLGIITQSDRARHGSTTPPHSMVAECFTIPGLPSTCPKQLGHRLSRLLLEPNTRLSEYLGYLQQLEAWSTPRVLQISLPSQHQLHALLGSLSIRPVRVEGDHEAMVFRGQIARFKFVEEMEDEGVLDAEQLLGAVPTLEKLQVSAT